MRICTGSLTGPTQGSRSTAERLDRVTRFEPSEVADYLVTPDQLAAVKTRMSAWATDVRSRAGHNPRPVRDGPHTPTPGADG